MITEIFVERLQAHLDRLNDGAQRGQRVTAYKVALEVGLDPTYVTNIFRGRKNGTPETIKRLASSKILQLSYERLRSWQAISVLEPEVLETCMREMDFNNRQVTQQNDPDTGLILYKWQLTDTGFSPISGTDTFRWNIKDLPSDVIPQLSSVQVINQMLWPPIPAGSVLLVRPIFPPHMLHAGRWYAVQLQFGDAPCRMVRYDPTLCSVNTLDAAGLPIALTINTLKYTFEIIQYQVNLLNT